MNTYRKLKSEVTLVTCFALALIIFGVRLQMIDIYATATPYWDGWGMGRFLYDHMVSGHTFWELFGPANSHRMFFAKVLNITLFKVNEYQWDPLLLMVANSLLWTLSGLFLFLFARNNRHVITPHSFIFIIMILWVFPSALINLIWGVQSHNYFMILFTLMGCWYVGYRPFSVGWLFGLCLLFAACLTMAGGTFASVSVACVYAVKVLLEKEKRKEYVPTMIAASIIAVFGLFLILIQKNPGGNPFAAKNVGDFISSFAKTLSWPLHKSTWPSLIFFAPVVILMTKALRAPEERSRRITAYVYSLAGFIIIVAIAVAYARGNGGFGPTRRYLEFLSLSIVCSFLAVLVLHGRYNFGSSRFGKFIIVAWLMCFIASFPTQLKVFQFTAQDRSVVNAANDRIVRNYIISGDENIFRNKPMRHVPYPNAKRLANWLNAFVKVDMLPMELQAPEMKTDSSGDGFVENGSILPSAGLLGAKYRGENVIGSYNMELGAQHAKGRYQSEELVSRRSYLVIPTLGYLGQDDLSLELLEVNSGKIIPVNPPRSGSRYAEEWILNYIKAPAGNYRIIASDQSDTVWFAFAAPRNIGMLSYISRTMIKNGQSVWQLGILLLVFALRNQILNVFRLPEPPILMNL